jgi:hypothetical protein
MGLHGDVCLEISQIFLLEKISRSFPVGVTAPQEAMANHNCCEKIILQRINAVIKRFDISGAVST